MLLDPEGVELGTQLRDDVLLLLGQPAQLRLIPAVIIVLLDHQPSPHLLQVLLQDLIVPVLLSQVVPLHQHDVAELVIHHSHERVDLIVVDLVVQFAADEAFAVGEGDLVDEDDSIFTAGDHVPAAGGSVDA